VAAMIKPIFLLADSQLLFFRDEGGSVLERARQLIEEEEPGKEILAAYIGASNGDAREFYDLFTAAMDSVGIRTTRMIPSEPSPSALSRTSTRSGIRLLSESASAPSIA